MTYIIRRAQIEDIRSSCQVRIAAWRDTYAGQVPPEILDAMDVEKDIARVQEMMNNPDNRSTRFIVEIDGKIVGTAVCGPARIDTTPGRGEIHMIYLLNEAKGKGLGKKLMQVMAKELARQGFTSVRLNVLDTNTAAIKFYENLGGVYAGESAFKMGDAELKDSFYVWENIRTLLSPPQKSITFKPTI